jgi:hypothetical protein
MIEGTDDEGRERIAYSTCKECKAKIEALEQELPKQDDKLRSLRVLDDQSLGTEQADQRAPDSRSQTQ